MVLPVAAASDPEAYTPQPGSAERKAILDALRMWVKQQHHLDVIFVVMDLKVQNGSARVHVLPQSKDGSSHYEDITADLQNNQGRWEVVEIYTPEEEDPAAAADSGPEAYTPPPGSAERKAMLDLLREWIKNHHYVDVIFVVRHLKVKDGHAWVTAMPRSKDGANMYEDISALLKKDKGLWEIAEIPCAEEDNPDCIGDPGYFDGLKQRFPELPEDILPL